MPVYPYECTDCFHTFDVSKRIANIDDSESCPACNSETTSRNISTKTSFFGADQWDVAAFDPVFGQVVKNNNHRRQLAKERNWTEVGNENPDKIHKHYEAQREKMLSDRWEKV